MRERVKCGAVPELEVMRVADKKRKDQLIVLIMIALHLRGRTENRDVTLWCMIRSKEYD